MRKLPNSWYTPSKQSSTMDESARAQIESAFGTDVVAFFKIYGGAIFKESVLICIDNDFLPCVDNRSFETAESAMRQVDTDRYRTDALPFASDSCGNDMLICKASQKILFFDHETNESMAIADSINEFLERIEINDYELDDPDAEVWIDPDFKPE